jgi:hypothetical protein
MNNFLYLLQVEMKISYPGKHQDIKEIPESSGILGLY